MSIVFHVWSPFNSHGSRRRGTFLVSDAHVCSCGRVYVFEKTRQAISNCSLEHPLLVRATLRSAFPGFTGQKCRGKSPECFCVWTTRCGRSAQGTLCIFIGFQARCWRGSSAPSALALHFFVLLCLVWG